MKKKLIFYESLELFKEEYKLRKYDKQHNYFIEWNKNTIEIHIFDLMNENYDIYHKLLDEYEVTHKKLS